MMRRAALLFTLCALLALPVVAQEKTGYHKSLGFIYGNATGVGLAYGLEKPGHGWLLNVTPLIFGDLRFVSAGISYSRKIAEPSNFGVYITLAQMIGAVADYRWHSSTETGQSDYLDRGNTFARTTLMFSVRYPTKRGYIFAGRGTTFDARFPLLGNSPYLTYKYLVGPANEIGVMFNLK